MKKMVSKIAIALIFSASTFAYNPPAGGQNLLKLTSPSLLSGANSTTGGAIFDVAPTSIVNNPALPAFNERNKLDAAGTLLFDGDDDDHSIGAAFNLGLSIASNWCVPTFLIQGVFVPYYDMQLGNNINITAGYSKELTDELAVGATVNAGVFTGFGTDWTASLALGALYKFGDFKFLKDLRFGASLSNLGKMYSNTEVWGIKDIKKWNDLSDTEKSTIKRKDIDGDELSSNGMWPGLATLRIGSAAKFIDTEKFALGMSLDLAFPTFQDVIADVGLQMNILKYIKVNTSWEFDLQEFKNDSKNMLPSVGVFYNFKFKAKNEYLAKNGWSQSEMTAGAAWKQLYKNVNAVSAGVVVDLGLKDEEAPEIILWGDE